MALILAIQMILSISMDWDWHLNKENEKQSVENTIGIHSKMSLYIYKVGDVYIYIYMYIKWACSHDFLANQVELGLPPVKKPHSVTFEREIRNRDNLLETGP